MNDPSPDPPFSWARTIDHVADFLNAAKGVSLPYTNVCHYEGDEGVHFSEQGGRSRILIAIDEDGIVGIIAGDGPSIVRDDLRPDEAVQMLVEYREDVDRAATTM